MNKINKICNRIKVVRNIAIKTHELTPDSKIDNIINKICYNYCNNQLIKVTTLEKQKNI